MVTSSEGARPGNAARSRALALVAWVAVCFGVSLVAFRVQVGAWPERDDVALSLTFVAPFAVPTSCARLLGLLLAPSPVALVVFALFWAFAGGLTWAWIAKGSHAAGIALGGLALASSVYLQAMTGAIIGI